LAKVLGEVGGSVVLAPALGDRLPKRGVDEIEVDPCATRFGECLFSLFHWKNTDDSGASSGQANAPTARI
jgi:hypothetical protein